MRKKGKDAAMAFVIQTARTYDPDPGHNETVTRVALALFDGLHALHEYGPTERRLLEIAARLHDIGWSRVVSGKHHKLSRDMILELDIPGLDERDRWLCALIAGTIRRRCRMPHDTGDSPRLIRTGVRLSSGSPGSSVSQTASTVTTPALSER